MNNTAISWRNVEEYILEKIPDFTAVCMCIYNTHRSTIAAVTFTSQKKI